MQVSTANNVKVYNLSSGRSLPEWLSDRKKRALLKSDVDLRRRIELIQDFTMPTASTEIRLSPDGEYIFTAGVYKPRVRCYDVKQLSMKFERCLDAEIVRIIPLSEDYSKFVTLQSDRYVEFHVQHGCYYKTRIPKFGHDMVYHYPSCDLYMTASGPEVYRLNLEQGRFLAPLVTNSSVCTVCQLNEEHQLFTVGTDEGTVECWDPRSRTRAGCLIISASEMEFTSPEVIPAVTALKYRDALTLAVGTSTGQVLLYDLRASTPLLIKDHYYSSPIHSIAFQTSNDLVLSADSKIMKIWNRNDGSAHTSVEPAHPLNQMCHIPESGLVLMAVEDPKMQAYYIPSLGPAPKWCSFLDNLTEELEETEQTVYDDYKFVTSHDLEELGLAHLVGTPLLRAYMHGYFVDLKLYHKARAIAEPFAYEEYRRKKIKSKIEEERASVVEERKLPKVNRQLAMKLLDQDKHPADSTNPLGDERFKMMFVNSDFQMDEESQEYKLLHPVQVNADTRQQAKGVRRVKNDQSKGTTRHSQPRGDDVKVAVQPVIDGAKPLLHTPSSGVASAPLGQRLGEGVGDGTGEGQVSSLGSKQITVKLQSSMEDVHRKEAMRKHRTERKQVQRSAVSIMSKPRKMPVYWKGRKVSK